MPVILTGALVSLASLAFLPARFPERFQSHRGRGAGHISAPALAPERKTWKGWGLWAQGAGACWVAPWGAGWSGSQQPIVPGMQDEEDPLQPCSGVTNGRGAPPEARHLNPKHCRPDRADASGTGRSKRHRAGGHEGVACPGQDGDAKSDVAHHGGRTRKRWSTRPPLNRIRQIYPKYTNNLKRF